jgi:hypothetical protein
MGGIPFPIPKDGNEAIWNSLLRYRGDTFGMHWSQAAVTRGGDYALVKFEYEYDFSYGNLSKTAAQRENNKVLNYVQNTTAPARLAGQILLVHETVDQTKEPRSAWTYNPGQRRVRLAPNVAYDNPGTAADGLRTNDDFGMYNGATDRYNWKLVGKREMYMPYNSYRLSDPKLKYADILKAGHINQDLARYELHRVWVVEATLKPGTSHIYTKRVFYPRRGQLDAARHRQVRRARRAVALRRAAQRELVQRADALPHGRGAQRPAIGPLHRHGLRSEERTIYEPLKGRTRATTRRRTCAAPALASRAGILSRMKRVLGAAALCCGLAPWALAAPEPPAPRHGAALGDHDAAPAAHRRGAHRQSHRRRRRPRLHRAERRRRRHRGSGRRRRRRRCSPRCASSTRSAAGRWVMTR